MERSWERGAGRSIRIACLFVSVAFCSAAFADPLALNLSGSLTSSTANGVNVGAGTYTTDQLASVANAIGTVTTGGYTGVPLWNLLGGNSTGTASDVLTDSGKNAILRSYVLATNSIGSQFIISLGEVDPFFGGAVTTAPFVAYTGGNGNPALIFPNQAAGGRDINNLTNLQVLSISAPAAGPGGPSTSFLLAGNVARPGVYTSANLQAFPSLTETVSGDIYTGVSLWNFLGADTTHEFTQYVLAEGTDGYEALFSLAELDPNLGAPEGIIPYADTAGQFPADGVVRVIIPGDNHAGRYVSNVSLLQVSSVPEPDTVLLIGLGVFCCTTLNQFRFRNKGSR